MQKRGLSDIVTTVLIILLVLAAVVIIWQFVKPVIQSGAENIQASDYTSNFEIQNVEFLGSNISFSVMRKAGSEAIVGMIITLADSNGNSSNVRYDFALQVLESYRFNINFSQLGLIDVKTVSVDPIFVRNGKEVQSTNREMKEVSQDQQNPIVTPPPANCGNGVINTSLGEECDGTHFSVGDGCFARGYIFGNLTCNSQCRVDASGCSVSSVGLVGYYPLDGNAQELFGEGLTGQVMGSISFVSGHNGGQAARFSATRDPDEVGGTWSNLGYIAVPHSSALDFDYVHSNLTIALWFKTVRGGPMVTKNRHDCRTMPYSFYASHSSVGSWIWHGPNGNSIDTGTPVDDNWHFAAFVLQGEFIHKIYVDGVLVTEDTSTSWHNPSADWTNTNPLDFGRFDNCGVWAGDYWSDYYNGDLDNVIVFNRPLSTSEIQQVMSLT